MGKNSACDFYQEQEKRYKLFDWKEFNSVLR